MKNMKFRTRSMLAGYAFAFPGMLFCIVYMGYPLVRSFYLSLCRYNFAFDQKPIFEGLYNYTQMFKDPYFVTSLKNTAVFSAGFFPGLMIISLILALLLDQAVKGSPIYRTCIFMAMVVPLSLTGIIFQWIFNSQYGLLNSFLSQVLHLPGLTHNWLGEAKWAMVSIIVVSLWKNMGMLVILFMAGLAAIPGDIIESARIDGANPLQRIFYVILPNLKESFVICGLWAIIQSVKVFEQPFVMTNGGPGTATLVLYQYTWQNAFKLYEMGYASAIGYFMGIIILVLSAINMYMNRDKDVDEVKKRRKAKLKAQKEGGAANA